MNLPVLTHITTLIGGIVRPHSKPGVSELTVNGARNMDRVFKYFDTHSLHTKKANSYRLWMLAQEKYKHPLLMENTFHQYHELHSKLKQLQLTV